MQLPLVYPRVTSAWMPGGAKTFRNRSRKLFGKYGTNLQNPSKSTLHIFTADPGYSFVQIDQAGAEALIVAYLCRAGNMRALFNAGIKPHTYVAMHLFKEKWEDISMHKIDHLIHSEIKDLKYWRDFKYYNDLIKNSKTEYFIGKKTCHSCNYSMGVNTFMIDTLKESSGKLVLSRSQAQHYLDTYHEIFPEIKEWHQEVKETISTNPFIICNMFGYPRTCYDDPRESSVLRDFISWVPQSTVGCISNDSIVSMYAFISEQRLINWHIMNNKHDSVLMMVPDNDINLCAKKLKEYTEVELSNQRGEKFRMKSEVKVGKNWGDWDEKENVLGMKELNLS